MTTKAVSSSVRNVPTTEDQKEINQFARLHKSYVDAKEKLLLLNMQLQNLNDAADEVLLMDDEVAASVPMQVGSVFVHYDQDALNEKIDERKEQAQDEISKMCERIARMESEMKELRAVLYAKFGDNIQLEDESNGDGNNMIGI